MRQIAGFALTIALGISLAACGQTLGAPLKTATVDHHTSICSGVGTMTCLNVDPEVGESEWWYDRPDGFEHEWGKTYRIEYREYERNDPPQDGSSLRREVESVEVLKSVDQGDDFGTFEFGGIHTKNATQPIVERHGNTTGRFALPDQTFACESKDICDQLEALDDDPDVGWKATLTYEGSGMEDLLVVGVEEVS